jgi:hypothetical protein
MVTRCAIFVVAFGVILSSGKAQEHKREVLIGWRNITSHEEHLYSVEAQIVDAALATKSDLVARKFIDETTKSDCPHAIWIGGDCFKCGDRPGHFMCTNDESVKVMLGRIDKVSDKAWQDAKESNFTQVHEWLPIQDALKINPAMEVKNNTEKARGFWSSTHF